MPAVRLHVTLEPRIVEMVRCQAKEQSQPVGRYLVDRVDADAKQQQAALAAESCRLLAADSSEFAGEALPATADTWPAGER